MYFTYKQIAWTIFFIIIAIFLMLKSTLILFEYAKYDLDWITALINFNGNIIGGIIGGLVAVIVARYQINKSKLRDNENKVKTTNSMLRLIREELKDNITLLSNSIPYNEEYQLIISSQISDDIWKSAMLHIDIKEDLLVHIHISYKKVSLLKNINNGIDDELLNSCKETMENALEYIKIHLNEEN